MMMNLPCLMASCANFLRPICSYTECRLSFQTEAYPTERTTASYSSCLFLLLLTFLCCRDSFIGRLSCFISWSWCWCSALHTPSGLRVSFPKPCPDPDKLWIPARVWNCNAILSSTYAACGIDWSGLTMSPNSFFGSFLSNLPLVSNSCQVDAFNSALIASAFAIISCCSKYLLIKLNFSSLSL